MYVLPDIFELLLYGVQDAGVPNRERIVMRAWAGGPVNLAGYFVTVGLKGAGNTGTPLFDGMRWLGEYEVSANQWVFVYTGPGTPRSSQTKEGEPLHVIHWGRDETLFGSPAVTPMLFKLGGIAVDQSPPHVLNPPQLPLLPTDKPPTTIADLARLGLPKK